MNRRQRRAAGKARGPGAPQVRGSAWVDSKLKESAAYHQAGRLAEAKRLYAEILSRAPATTMALHLLGALKYQEGDARQAVELIGKAIALQPDCADAHFNLGTALQDLGRLEDALASYRKALELKPDLAAAHNNLGVMLKNLGRLDEALDSYHKALAIEPHFADAWTNLKLTMKALQFPKVPGDRRGDLYGDGLGQAARATGEFAMLQYYLDKFRPHEADEGFRTAMAALPPKTAVEVTENGVDRDSANLPQLPDKLVALLNFGRSGTGLLHSLIDGHAEISTLPSIYLSGYFGAGVWNQIAADGWRGLPERFADQFAVLFDAASPKHLPGLPIKETLHMGRKEGMTAVGKDRNISLSLDRDKFCAEALRLMKNHGEIDPISFLLIVHAAFEKTIGTKTGKHLIFYHIHNPDSFTKLNFLRYAPDARLVMMVREPIQSCESWIRLPFKENNYSSIVARIIQMLFAIDQVAFRTQDSLGVRLEDLKRQPKATMRALCAWLGVEETPSLYESTAQGEKWWGDPTSPEYNGNEAMSPFGEAPIRRAVGMIFSEKDQLVLRTLFYPFSVRFGYREPDPAGFKRDLKEIRPLLDDLMDFETALSERLEIDPAQFERSGTYRMLRASFLDRWDVLDQFGDYPGMLTPLDIA